MSLNKQPYSQNHVHSEQGSSKPASEGVDMVIQQARLPSTPIPRNGFGSDGLNAFHLSYLQRTIGNQAVQRLLRTSVQESEAISATDTTTSNLTILLRDTGRTASGTSVVPDTATLRTAIGKAVSQETLSIAIYTGLPGLRQHDQETFKASAQSFAKDHLSIGIRDGHLVVGMNAAMAAMSAADVVDAVKNTINKVRELLGSRDIKINTLALFAHGVNGSDAHHTRGQSYLNLGGGHEIGNSRRIQGRPAATRLQTEDFAKQISVALADSARVVLYACELGDTFDSRQNRLKEQDALADELGRGEGSFADELRDLLNATGTRREVWGHRTTAHTTANSSWRRYGSGSQQGADNLFGDAIAQPGLSASQGWRLNQSNIIRAEKVVKAITALVMEKLKGEGEHALLQRLENRRVNKGLRGWVARELPFAPTPFVKENTLDPRDEVITFLINQAYHHEGN